MLNKLNKNSPKCNKFKIMKIINKKKMETARDKDLVHYKIEPSQDILRKMDFYYTPYEVNYQSERGMTFEDGINNNCGACKTVEVEKPANT